MDAPKKYAKINGIMKLNPEYKAWKEKQNAATAASSNNATVVVAATTVLDSSEALPVVSSIEDSMELNDNLGEEIPLAEATNETISMLQEADIASETCLSPDDMIDQLGEVLSKYEIPIGLINKLMLLSEYQSLEFIVDDSGSMRRDTDTIDKRTNKPISRWTEAKNAILSMIEIIAYVPFQQIGIEFLNRTDRIDFKREGRNPHQFISDSSKTIEDAFKTRPIGTTPALEKLLESFTRGERKSIARYFFGDGKPNGGQYAIEDIKKVVKNRNDPEQNPITFISCTNDDDAVEWMKNIEEIAPYCSEVDDFNDEAREIRNDQGPALPYTVGFHLICSLVGAMYPDDLDAMDESIPFTKYTLDNLLGVVSNEESYRHYFNSFVQAQKSNSKLDTIRKNTQWEYESFLTTNGPAKRIPQVQQIKQQLKDMK